MVVLVVPCPLALRVRWSWHGVDVCGRWWLTGLQGLGAAVRWWWWALVVVSSAKTSPGMAVCHAVWHNSAVATVRSYFKSVSPMFKRSNRHITICNPSEAKTPVWAVSPAQLHCLTR